MTENIFSIVMGTFCQNTAFLLTYRIKSETTVYVVCSPNSKNEKPGCLADLDDSIRRPD